jgi:hypothetical protein
MTSAQRIERLEHRVHELQTALASVVRRMGLEEQVAGDERARLDEIKFTGEIPDRRLLELYTRPHASP